MLILSAIHVEPQQGTSGRGNTRQQERAKNIKDFVQNRAVAETNTISKLMLIYRHRYTEKSLYTFEYCGNECEKCHECVERATPQCFDTPENKQARHAELTCVHIHNVLRETIT